MKTSAVFFFLVGLSGRRVFLDGTTRLWVVDTVPYAGSVFTVRWPYNK